MTGLAARSRADGRWHAVTGNRVDDHRPDTPCVTALCEPFAVYDATPRRHDVTCPRCTAILDGITAGTYETLPGGLTVLTATAELEQIRNEIHEQTRIAVAADRHVSHLERRATAIRCREALAGQLALQVDA